MKTPAPSPKKRRTQAERTENTQRKLILAAIEMLKLKRYEGFRTAEVAEAAGVSKGAQTHHFPSKESLVLEALEEVYEQTKNEALARISSANGDSTKLLYELVTDSQQFFLSANFLLTLDLLMVNPQSTLGSSVKELALRYRRPVEESWINAFVSAGHDRMKATDVVTLTYSLARGYGVRQLISDPEENFKEALQSWLPIAQGLLGIPSAP